MRMSLPVHQESTAAPVRTLMVYLTEDCNLRCTYCFVAKKKRSMSAEVARKTVDFFLSPQVSGSERDLQINFFGGEPLLEVDRMEEILRRTREMANRSGRRVEYSVTTNGTLFSERIAALVREFDVALLYSLDGGPSVTGASLRLGPLLSRPGGQEPGPLPRGLPGPAHGAHDLPSRGLAAGGARRVSALPGRPLDQPVPGGGRQLGAF